MTCNVTKRQDKTRQNKARKDGTYRTGQGVTPDKARQALYEKTDETRVMPRQNNTKQHMTRQTRTRQDETWQDKRQDKMAQTKKDKDIETRNKNKTRARQGKTKLDKIRQN